MLLVIANVDPVFEHAPALENVTAPPGAVAVTEKLEPNVADNGACVDTVIVWFAFGVTGFESADCDPVPTPFTAATRKVYVVPFVNPVTVVCVTTATLFVDCATPPMKVVTL